jgi:small conductance mechanosensitive channel
MPDSATWQAIQDKAIQLLVERGPSVLVALAILLIGRWTARFFIRLLRRALSGDKLNQTVVGFLCNLAYIALLTVVVLAALDQVGVDTKSFIVVLGAAGLAVGLALQGSLANFAAGVLLVFFQPFRVGDVIEAAGAFGTVEEIQLFCTVIKTPQGTTVIIPNNSVSGGNIINFTRNGTMRIDMTFGISYGADIREAKRILGEIVGADERVLKDPAPTLGVKAHGASSIDIACNVWIKPADKWAVWFDAHERAKYAFDEAGIGIPFPQRDVHLYTHDVK